jgi:hypothetical protein
MNLNPSHCKFQGQITRCLTISNIREKSEFEDGKFFALDPERVARVRIGGIGTELWERSEVFFLLWVCVGEGVYVCVWDVGFLMM